MLSLFDHSWKRHMGLPRPQQEEVRVGVLEAIIDRVLFPLLKSWIWTGLSNPWFLFHPMMKTVEPAHGLV